MEAILLNYPLGEVPEGDSPAHFHERGKTEAAGREGQSRHTGRTRRHHRRAGPLEGDRSSRTPLGQLLIERGLIAAEDLDRALELQRERRGEKLGRILVDMGYHRPARSARRALGTARPAHRATGRTRPPASAPELEGLSPRFLRQSCIFPVAIEEGTLTLAMADPLDFETINAVQSFSRLEVQSAAGERAGHSRRHRPLLHRRRPPDRRGGIRHGRRRRPRTSARYGERSARHPAGERHDRAGDREARQRHPHRAVRQGIPHPLPRGRRALQSGAAAARTQGRHHFAPEADGEAQYRRTPASAGRPHQDPHSRAAKSICAFPRCPRFSAKASSCVCSTGRRAISTICAGWVSTTTCSSRMEHFTSLPHGIFLVTGPTGSGKSTTLYSALKRINLPDKKIITIEDPVEYQMDGINQIHVNPQIGLTFAAGIAAHRPPGSGRDHGRRNPRSRDGGYRDSLGAHRTLRFLDAAHERRAERGHAADGYGRGELSDHVVRGRDSGAASGPADLRRTAGRARARR